MSWIVSGVVIGCVVFFFCCKQKTAYEMRISDWSSACALPISGAGGGPPAMPESRACPAGRSAAERGEQRVGEQQQQGDGDADHRHGVEQAGDDEHLGLQNRGRSEEHTSELQSLTRSSYDDVCLKTKRVSSEKGTQYITLLDNT